MAPDEIALDLRARLSHFDGVGNFLETRDHTRVHDRYVLRREGDYVLFGMERRGEDTEPLPPLPPDPGGFDEPAVADVVKDPSSGLKYPTITSPSRSSFLLPKFVAVMPVI